MSEVIFLEGVKYCYGVDTFFDTSVLFEIFIRYIGSYESCDSYLLLSTSEHSDNHFSYLENAMSEKWTESIQMEKMAIEIFGSLKEAISKGIYHPL